MKDALILQDKKFISAKRAAVIFGYSSDYVGQLCREGKIECTMVGRSWFVSEESVLNHKLSSSDPKVASDDSVKIVLVPATQKALTSETTESLLGPDKSIKDFVVEMAPIPQVAPIANVASIAPVSPITPVSPIVKQEVKQEIDTAPVKVVTEPAKPVEPTKRVLKTYSKFDLSLVIIFLLLSAVLLGKNFISYFPYSSKNMVATVFNGVVVAPATPDSTENESIKNDLRDPFSDEVEIKPDSSGTAGVIVPVFKESKGDDFLYVMVPVKDSNQNENK